MKAITLYEPWATLIALRLPCLTCRNTRQVSIRQPGEHGGEMGAEYDWEVCGDCPDPVKWIETRSWAAPAAMIGHRLAIHAAKAPPAEGLDVGGYLVEYDMIGEPHVRFPEPFADLGEGEWHSSPLRPGHIVASCVLTACVPMTDQHTTGAHILLRSSTATLVWDPTMPFLNDDIIGQVPFGLFQPGRVGWILDDVAPTYERCPTCWNTPDVHCFRCMSTGGCPPIPARGFQRVWNWDEPIVPEPDVAAPGSLFA